MLCRANFSTQRPHGRAAISAALRMLCRANSSTHRPPGRTLHKKRMPHLRVTSFFLFSYSSARCRHGVREGGPARAGCPTGCRPDALPCQFQRPASARAAVLAAATQYGCGPVPAAALRTLCRADFSAQSPSARLRCRGLPFWPRGPHGRTAIPAANRTLCRADFNAQSPSARLRLLPPPVLAVRPRGRARFCLFAVARRCAGCLSWCAAPAFCSRRPCCRSAGQGALLQSGCRSGTACRAAPSCRQRTAG